MSKAKLGFRKGRWVRKRSWSVVEQLKLWGSLRCRSSIKLGFVITKTSRRTGRQTVATAKLVCHSNLHNRNSQEEKSNSAKMFKTSLQET